MGKEKLTITFRFNEKDPVWYMANNEIIKAHIAIMHICKWDSRNGKYLVFWLLDNSCEIKDSVLFASQLEIINHLTGANL
jgi:hypothetical protein